MNKWKNIPLQKTAWVTVVAMLFMIQGFCQTMFTALRSHVRQADRYYTDGNFREASVLYSHAFKKHPSRKVNTQIARCYYFMGRFDQAASWYEKYVNAYGDLSATDSYHLAETYATLGDYEKAIQKYNVTLKQKPNDILVAKKVWRLRNIQFLYEDSLHYATHSLNMNTTLNEFGAVPYKDGLVFLSNPEIIQLVDNRDATTQASFYKLYYTSFVKDTVSAGGGKYSKPKLLEKDFGSRFHEGRVAFFNRNKRMAYTASSDKADDSGRRTLQLHFAELREGNWVIAYSFPYNSTAYSIIDPTISEDGKILYFASEMDGGQGGKDLYRSDFMDGKWSKPVNLVDLNTPYDEVSPFLHNSRTLYFSSTGHAGMGGLDVFRTEIVSEGFTEVSNMGYPVNTRYNDFSFVVDSLGIRGYLSSNRNDAHQDDVYSVDIDMQAYPLVIEGIIRYKEADWKDSVAMKEVANAKLILIDNLRGVPVFESISDTSGNFVLHIPYFSQYKIKVIEENKHESLVSLEVPRHRKADMKHEIVVVHDVFKTNPETR